MVTSALQNYLVNGSRDCRLSPLDRGFAYGDGIFRTLVIENGQPQHWNLHYTKLLNDCHALGIVCSNAAILLNDINQLFDQTEHAVAKIIITRGEAERGYAMPALAQPTRIIIKSLYPQYAEGNFSHGVRLRVCQTRLAIQPQLAGIKHLNRLENVLARTEWSDTGIVDGVMLDTDDRVIECTMSNIFARFGQSVMTPDLSRCGVAGITRQRILDCLAALAYQPLVSEISLDALLQADEVLICNSLFSVWQVLDIDGTSWSPQPLASQLRKVLQT